MKILLLSSRFFPHIGGVEKVVESLARNFLIKNDVVVLSSLDDSSNFSSIENGIIDKDGYKLKRIWMNLPRSILGFLIFPYRFLRSLYSLVKFLKRQKPDVINFHFLDDVSIYLWFALLFYNAPLVINIHGNDLHVFSKKFLYKKFISDLLDKSTSIVVNSDYMKLEFLQVDSFKKHASKVSIIPNGLEISGIQKIKPTKYLKNDYLFFVGRFVHKKGVDLLINAFSEIEDTNLSLVLEGNGEEFNNIKNLITKKGLQGRVLLTAGKLSEDDKFAIIKGSLMGIIPSRIEPFGIVALEYLAAGVPIVASNTGGLSSILKNSETCLFFENGNVHDLKEKIMKLRESSSLRKKLMENGLNEVKKYSWENICVKYLDLYKLGLN